MCVAVVVFFYIVKAPLPSVFSHTLSNRLKGKVHEGAFSAL